MITRRVVLYVAIRCLIILLYCLLLSDTYNAQVNEASSNCDCQITLDNSFQVVPFDGYDAPEYRNDDASSPLIEFPFEFCLFDQSYNSCYINNNGNISFGSPYGTFSSSTFPNNYFIMIAPFWADVDTRNPESGLPYYKITDHYMIVIWDRVGYFPDQADKLNTFQVIISDGSDPIIPNGNNVQFCYKDMQWTTGSASSGVNGFGGTPATVGTNKGDGFSFTQFGRFDQAGFSYDGPFLQPDGVSWLDDVGIAFDSCTPNESINVKPVSIDSGACDTLYVCAGDTMSLIYFAPELDQSISFNYESNLPQNTVYWVDQGQGYSWFNFIVPEDFNSSLSYFLELNVSDNAIPIGQIQEFYTIVASESVQLDISLLSGGACNNIILQASPIMGNLYWNSGAQSSSLEIFSPGQYTVYSTIGSCISEASISISNENFNYAELNPFGLPDTLIYCLENGLIVVDVNIPANSIVQFDESIGLSMSENGELIIDTSILGQYEVLIQSQNNGCAETLLLIVENCQDAYCSIELSTSSILCAGDSIQAVVSVTAIEAFEITQQGPSGGYVFYDKGNNDGGWRYLEVAPYDISAGAPWSCFGTLVEGLQSDIGSGDINTNSITQQCGNALSAASTCENAIINGFDDWYLPNQAEMNLILNTLYSQGIGGFNSGVGLNVATSQFNRYWTSSQSDLNTGIVQDFTPSGNGVSSKNNLHRVRPIRKFSDFDNLTYLWSTGASNDTIWVSPESTTTYTCSVFWNDQECTSSVEVEVISDSFSLDSSDSLLCLGETITLVETGFDTIQWSDGSQSESLTISALGDYWASAVLSGCDVHSDTLTVSESSLIIYTEPSDTVSFCGTSVIELTAYGGDSYMWNTGELSNTLQVTSEGIYYVVGFDSDCSGVSNSVYVIEESNIDINVFTEENVLCLNSAPAQLLATPEGGTWSGIGVEGNLFYPSLSGVGAFVITYSYEDSNGCQASANIFLAVNDCVNVEEITSNLYSIYPNPTSGVVTVLAKNLSEVALQIYSADGRLVKSFDYGGVTSLLDLTPLSNGIYFVNIQDKYSSYQMKLLKQ